VVKRRTLTFLAAGMAVFAIARPAAADYDPWWGRDKALHFGVSAGLAAGGYAASAPFLEQRWQRAAAGGGFALVLGAGKEAYDATGHGDASFKDFTWDVAGAAVGVVVALLVDVIASGSATHEPAR
jgi:putative lipoprotein